MTIRHLLERKGSNVWTIGSDATVLDAVATMADKDVTKDGGLRLRRS